MWKPDWKAVRGTTSMTPAPGWMGKTSTVISCVIRCMRPTSPGLGKDRLTVMDVLRQWGVSEGIVERVGQLPRDQDFREKEFDLRLREQIPKVGESTRGRIREAAALAAYHAEAGHVRLLVCDDAQQFQLVADELALCWVHDGRHYHSLEPCVPQHAELLKAFRKRYGARPRPIRRPC